MSNVRQCDAASTTPIRAGTGRLRVVHLPVFSENAYQPLLMRSLAGRGLQVIDGGGGGDFLRTALFRWKADLYHFHWLHPYLLRRTKLSSLLRATRFLLEVLSIRLSGARVVWTIHNLVNHDRRFPTIERLYSLAIAHLTDGIIVHSERGRMGARQAFKLSGRKRIAVIPQGSYVEHYPNQVARPQCRAKLALPGDAFVFLFLGRIEPYKGVLELIRCFKHLRGKARLLVAGCVSNPTLRAELHEEIANSPHVRLDEQFVPNEELQTYFNAADAFVFPARDVLHSSSIALAMSFGLACIAPGLDGIREMLGENGGILYDPREPQSLLTAMESAMEMRDELLALGRYNLSRARERSWGTVAERTAALYQCVLDDGSFEG